MSGARLSNLGTTSTFDTRPDGKMGRELDERWSSAQNAEAKRNAAKKRRQRDKKVGAE